MAILDNTSVPPPPTATPITAAGGEQFGIPFQHRPESPVAAGDLAISWAAWFQRVFQRLRRGNMEVTQANLPANLTDQDAGVIVQVTDYGHLLRWNGSGWGWAPGDNGSGYMALFEVDPVGVGWQLYDGSTVSYLKSDGTLGSITLPDLTSAANKAAYLKAGSPNSGPSAASAPGISGSTANASTGITLAANTGSGAAVIGSDNDAGGTSAVAAGNTYALKPHNHTDSGHTHPSPSLTDPQHLHGVGTLAVDATGEPRHLERRAFFRL